MHVWRALSLVLLLAGCARLGLPDMVPEMPELPWRIGFSADPKDAPPPAGPALRMGLGSRQADASLLLASGERRVWRTDAGVVVALDGARVVATSGLSQSLTGTQFDGADPLADPRELAKRATQARRQVDLAGRGRDPKDMRFGIALVCRLSAAPLPEDAAVLLVKEDCSSPALSSFTNRFWANAASGAILRSEQWIGPGLPMLRLREVSPGS